MVEEIKYEYKTVRTVRGTDSLIISKTVAFNGSIVKMTPHAGYETRFDLLLGPGDKGPDTAVGPAFKYEDVSILDLELTGKKIPATVGEGDKFRFVAKVGQFNADQCLFFLAPVSTEVR
ncbi:DUF4839 domain-containing protein [Actinoplanes sp. M2I2]|uniref:DUF4839 domain-containing protein n=1 Tax=Actinoplanes sp. M2I2 TaxID=1734444 RepID=UPI00202028D0|nr:DUF4839 domain-containing protein [Actinoplanes sp. M2I2]